MRYYNLSAERVVFGDGAVTILLNYEGLNVWLICVKLVCVHIRIVYKEEFWYFVCILNAV